MARNQKIVTNRRVVGSKKGSGRILVSALLLLAIFAIAASNMAVKGVSAATAPSLGTASSFAILAGTPKITDVPTSHIIGDVGLQPTGGSGIGLTCGEVTGTIYSNDGTGPVPCQVTNLALLVTAKNDLTHAYNDVAGRTPTTTFGAGDNQLGGQTLIPGVYAFGGASTANLIGTLKLDAQGDPSAVFIFQASSTLVTASSSVVLLVNGASACNVFWQVTSSATLGTSSTFVGTIMALTSITLTTGVTLNGRALAQTGEVTLDSNTVSQPCSIVTVTTTTTVIGGTTYTVTYTEFGLTLPTVGPGLIPEYPWGVMLLLIPMLLVYLMLKRRNPSH